MNTHEYEITDGTEANADEQHEPRTMTHTITDEDGNGTLHMMTEIGDGVFAAWDRCRRCNKAIKSCQCPGGPVEPEYMQRWREERFSKSFEGRKVDPPLPVTLRARDRRVAAVMRFLLARGYRIEAPMTEQLATAEPANVDTLAIDGLTDEESADFIEAIDGAERAEEETVESTVDDGLDAALEKVRTAKKEDDYDAGF